MALADKTVGDGPEEAMLGLVHVALTKLVDEAVVHTQTLAIFVCFDLIQQSDNTSNWHHNRPFNLVIMPGIRACYIGVWRQVFSVLWHSECI